MEISNILLIFNCFSTFYMIGLIWMVQIVHYPLFALVGRSDYQQYQARHQALTTLVVGPPMLIEAFTSVLLAWYPPHGVNYGLIFAGIGLMFLIWISTAAIQVPCHGRLASGYETTAHRRLVLSNWFRTIAWTARGLLVGWMLLVVLAAS